MHSGGFFFQAFIYLSAAVISVPIAKRLGLGSVLGYLIAGMIIGPFGLGLIGEEGQDVMHFAEFGVVMMLFLIGLELQPALLWRMRGPILGLGGLQVSVTAIVIMLIAIIAGLAWQSSLAIGLILALSSTAIVLQTLNEKGLMKTQGGKNSFAILLFQDIAVIPMLAFLPFLAVTQAKSISSSADHGSSLVAALPAWAQTLIVLAAMAFIILAGRYLISPLFRVIAKTRMREIFTAAALLLVIGIALLMTLVGLSPALGTFLAGVVLAGSEYRHELESDIDPFKGLLLGLFFIAVGASIDFALISGQPMLIAQLVAVLMLLKFILLFFLGRVFKMSLDNNLMLAFSLAQSGEFAFVLFSFAVQNNVLPENIVAILIAVVAISMALTPLFMLLNEKLIQPRFGTKESEEKEADSIDEENKVIIAGFGRFGNITGRLLRANGISATVLDLDSDNVDVLRKLGLKVFYGDASRHDLLHAAGAENAEIIILAIDDSEKNIEMVETIRKHYPHLKIFVRANGRADAYDLLDMGVDHVYRETFDTSLQVGIDVLKELGLPAYQAQRSSYKFRKTDEKDLRDLAKLRHDKKSYIYSARQRIEDLEQSMHKDLEGHKEERDAGWDTTSLREEFSGSSDK